MTTLAKPGRRGVIARVTRPFVFLMLVLGLVAGAELSAAIATEFLSTQEAELGRLLNEERVERGLPELSRSAALRTIARRHAQRMMVEGQIFHNEQLRQDVEAVFPAWASIGENVGVGPTIPAVHQAFMDSPGHRANILDPDYEWMGMGVVSGGSRLFMTQNFLLLQPGAPRPIPSQLRLAGESRTGTSQSVSDFGFAPGTAGGAVVADAFDFHGALAGASLAGAVKGPILLSALDTASPEALDGLERALGNGSGKTVYLVGGPFSPGVVAAIEGLGLETRVVGDADHVATAAAVARALPTTPNTAFISTVDNYPDALAGSAVSAVTGFPVLYTDPAGLDAEAAEAIGDLGIDNVIVLGGEGAVSNGVVRDLNGLGANVSRIAGATRIETSVAIADYGITQGMSTDHVQIATGFNFPDALAGGALADVLRAPVVLTHTASISPPTFNWLAAHSAQIDAIYLLGGDAAISSNVEDGIAQALS